MPDANSEEQSIEKIEAAADTAALPPVVPPATKSPIQFNQQVNLSIQQIPSSAWDRLSADQILEISKMIVTLAGFGATLYLSLQGHEFVAMGVALPLGTILAVIIGNRFLDR
jgi:hypothetical protein